MITRVDLGSLDVGGLGWQSGIGCLTLDIIGYSSPISSRHYASKFCRQPGGK